MEEKIPDEPCHFHDAAYLEGGIDADGDAGKLSDVMMHAGNAMP